MTKTFAVILNHNTPEYSDRLYKMLKPYERNDYELYVFDNGSTGAGKSKHATFATEQNVFFGGALNMAFQHVLDNPQYDSLLFLNSDLIINGYNYVAVLRASLNEYALISSCVIQPEEGQCYWPTMHNWGCPGVRNVMWIDFQCPLISRRLIEEIKQFDPLLQYGWGNDVYSGIICKIKRLNEPYNNPRDYGTKPMYVGKWGVGVVDRVTAIHLGSATIKKHSDTLGWYNQKAEEGMNRFFAKINKLPELGQMRERAFHYKVEYAK